MNLYDIESLQNRINLMENELEMLKHWVNLLIEESNRIVNVDSKSAMRQYDMAVTHGDPLVIITE